MCGAVCLSVCCGGGMSVGWCFVGVFVCVCGWGNQCLALWSGWCRFLQCTLFFGPPLPPFRPSRTTNHQAINYDRTAGKRKDTLAAGQRERYGSYILHHNEFVCFIRFSEQREYILQYSNSRFVIITEIDSVTHYRRQCILNLK